MFQYIIVLIGLCHAFYIIRQYLINRVFAHLKSFSWKGTNIVLTGASSGIGRSFALRLADPSMDVRRIILYGRNVKELKKVSHEMRTINPNLQIQTIECDLSKPHDALKKVKELKTPVDVFINNAGLSQRCEFLGMEYDACEYIMNVNTQSPIALTTHLIKGMVERQGGMIVNILSVSALVPVPLRTMYCASKYALAGMMRTLRSEVTQHNVRVFNVYPYYVQTNVSNNAMTGDGARFEKTDRNIANGCHPSEVVDQTLDAIENNVFELVLAPVFIKMGLFFTNMSDTITNVYIDRQYRKQVATLEDAEKET